MKTHTEGRRLSEAAPHQTTLSEETRVVQKNEMSHLRSQPLFRQQGVEIQAFGTLRLLPLALGIGAPGELPALESDPGRHTGAVPPL